MSYSKTSYWNDAITSEIESIMNNHMLKLMDLSYESKLLDDKQIF